MVTIEFLKELIQESEMSCKEIADNSGVSVRYLYYLLEGKYKDISLGKTQQLLKVFGKNIAIR